MDSIRSLLKSVQANRGDSTKHLQLAELLRQQGDTEWSGLIRLQVERAEHFSDLRQVVSNIDLEFFSRREQELVTSLQKQFEEGSFNISVTLNRGFVQAELDVESFAHPTQLPAKFVQLFEQGWVDKLTLLSRRDKLAALNTSLNSELLSGIQNLEIRGFCGTEGINAVVNSPHLSNIKSLAFTHHSQLGDEGATLLARAANLSSLGELHLLDGCRVLGHGLAAIGSSSQFPQLRTFSYNNARFSEKDAAQFVESLERSRIESITFAFLNDRIAEVFGKSVNIERWKCIELVSSLLSNQGVRALLYSEHIRTLDRLKIHNAPQATSTDGILATIGQANLNLKALEYSAERILGDELRDAAHVEYEWGSRLQAVTIRSYQPLSEDAVQHLVRWVNQLIHLDHLDLSDCQFADEVAENTLTHFLHGRTLSSLHLCPLSISSLTRSTDDEPEMLRKGDFKRLRLLTINSRASMSDIASLVISPELPALEYLKVPPAAFGKQGASLTEWRLALAYRIDDRQLTAEEQANNLMQRLEQGSEATDETDIYRDMVYTLADLVQTGLDITDRMEIQRFLLDHSEEYISCSHAFAAWLLRVAARNIDDAWEQLNFWFRQVFLNPTEQVVCQIKSLHLFVCELLKLDRERTSAAKNFASQLSRRLHQHLDDCKPDVALAIIEVVDSICERGLFPNEIESILFEASKHPSVRSWVANAYLSRGVSNENAFRLCDWLDDPDLSIRFDIIRTLGHEDSSVEVFWRLSKCLSDPNEEVRHAAIEAINFAELLNDQWAATLEMLLEDPSIHVSRAAAKTLAHHNRLPMTLMAAVNRSQEIAREDGSWWDHYAVVLPIAEKATWPELIDALLDCLTRFEYPLTIQKLLQVIMTNQREHPALPSRLAQVLLAVSDETRLVVLKELVPNAPSMMNSILVHLETLRSEQSSSTIDELKLAAERITNLNTDPEFFQLIQSGERVKAVLLYKRIMGEGLTEAKAYVEEQMQKRANPLS